MNSGKVEYVAVGKVVGCFGIRGFAKLQMFGPSPDRLKGLEQCFIGTSAEHAEACAIEQVEVRERQGVLVKFKGIDSRTGAESLVGKYLFVDQPGAIEPGKGSFLIDDIIGCEVITVEGTVVGKIEEVYKLPAQDVWAIRNGKDEILIPAVKEFVKSVDLQKKRIVLQVIEGLLDRSAG